MKMDELTKIGRLEFYVHKVLDCTSRYNYTNSYYYAPTNLVGKYEQYPSYGDFPEAYCLRFYGNWWKNSESYQPNYRPQDFDHLGAEDYVTVEFEGALIPKDICVYEVYNPGAVVRIWGKLLFKTQRPWILLWEGPPEKLPHKSRKFHPKIRQFNYLINTIRLEFNQSNLEYHYAVEAVLMGGYQPASKLEAMIMSRGILNSIQANEPNIKTAVEDATNRLGGKDDNFLHLPNEVILHIFQYLDLKSLSRCAKVNKRWNMVSSDALLYQNVNLKPYWYLVNCDTLKYFMDRCKSLKKLDLSWCGNDIDGFGQLVAIIIGANSCSLTHLSLGNCKYLNCQIMLELSTCRELVDLRLRNTNSCFNLNYPSLDYLNKLVSLDLTSSDIQDGELISVLKSNPHLRVIVLDLCENLQRLDQVVETVVEYNKNISTWSSWKTFSLTAEGVRQLSNCHNLQELDLGWCFINKDPGNSLNYIAEGCPKLKRYNTLYFLRVGINEWKEEEKRRIFFLPTLYIILKSKRLILSEWRGLSDNLVAPIIMSCKELTQLDFLGIKTITNQTCEKALMLLPKLRLLDLCYCDSILQEEVNLWRQQYPHITIQLYNC